LSEGEETRENMYGFNETKDNEVVGKRQKPVGGGRG